MKKLVLFMLLAVLMLAACGENDNRGLRATGTLIVNGPGWNGSAKVGTERIYALSDIVAGKRYTVRTMIATDVSLTTGTLKGNIYKGETDYRNNTIFKSLVSEPTATYIYEADFTAESSGTYFIAMSGTPNDPAIDSQFFYDLRIMSADALTSFATTTIPATNTAFLNAGYVHIYNGTTVSTAGTYTVSLTSKATTTLGNPQMFIYSSPSLTIPSLIYSSFSTTSDYYTVNTIVSGVTTTSFSPTNSIPNVTFSSTGPYILLKGNSSIEYTLTVGP